MNRLSIFQKYNSKKAILFLDKSPFSDAPVRLSFHVNWIPYNLVDPVDVGMLMELDKDTVGKKPAWRSL